MLNRNEISDITGFDHGTEFTNEPEVRAYFTVENMQTMGLGGEPIIDQNELDQMADLVIEKKWHCRFPHNTKARHLEIYTAAVSAIEAAGGVEAIDKLPEPERIATLKSLYKQVETAAACHPETARKSIAQAMRKARYGLMVAHGWGGARSGPHTGRPKKTIE